MKTTMRIWKSGLAALFLMVTQGAMGQSLPAGTQLLPNPMGPGKLGPANPAVVGNLINDRADLFDDGTLDFTNELTNATLFYMTNSSGISVTGLTMVASKLEDKLDRNDPFTAYRWFYMGQDPDNQSRQAFSLGTPTHHIPITGIENPVGTPDAHKLTVNGLTPGYHVFQVEGIMNPDGAEETDLCDPEMETIIIYVLPPLTLASTGQDPSGNFQYCEVEAMSQTAVSLQTTVQFTPATAPTVSPSVEEFEKRYRYYAIKQQDDDTYQAFDDQNVAVNPLTLPGVSLLNDPGSLTNSGLIEAFNPNMNAYGKYRILAEVEYTVKDRQFGTTGDATNARVRPHAIFRTLVMDGANPLEIIVTPQPGKPHITIESVID